MEAHQVSNMICKVRLLKSRIRICTYLEDIITSTNEVFKDLESDSTPGIQKPSSSTWEAVKRYVIGKYKVAC